MSLLCAIYPLSDDSALSLSDFMSLALPCCCAPVATPPSGRPVEAPKPEATTPAPASMRTEGGADVRRAPEEEKEMNASSVVPPERPVTLDARALHRLGGRRAGSQSEEQRPPEPSALRSHPPEYKRPPVEPAAVRMPSATGRASAANTNPPVPPPAKPRAVVTSLDLSGLSAEVSSFKLFTIIYIYNRFWYIEKSQKIMQLVEGSRK
jgi:hypothetical protein